MQVTLPIKTPFRTSTDREIIEGIKKADSEKDLKFFQYEFYNRFAPYIYKVALLCCRNFNDADFLSREILQLTFINAYRNISRFDFPVESEDSDCTNLTKAWLGKIANNEFRRALSKKVNDTVDFDSLNLSETPSDDLFTNLYEEPEQEVTNAFKLKLQEAMN
ncbi:MAG TPA: hypothetical protein VHD35_03800, partial [Chitinophagaceae bacterium]|nr:hypothetical protein [Chitinophagaceae bacterium]